MSSFLRTQSPRIYAYWVFCALVLFFVFHRVWFERIGILEGVFSTMAYPCIAFKARLINPLIDWYRIQKSNKILQEEVDFLRQRNQEILSRVIALEAEIDFVEKSREFVQYAQRYQVSQVRFAQIVAKQCTAHQSHMIVDLGSCHGIEVDMVALVKNCIVGKVIQVFPYWSRVALMSDKACKVAVTCARSGASGIYEGANNGGGFLQFVSHLAPIAQNDLLLTSGEGLVFPQGFGIGYIDKFEKKELTYEVRVRPHLRFLKAITHSTYKKMKGWLKLSLRIASLREFIVTLSIHYS